MFRHVISGSEIENKELVYHTGDYAFDLIGGHGGGGLSVLINDLQLELSDQGEIKSIWGICPHLSWKQRKLMAPSPASGKLVYVDHKLLVPGIAFRINQDSRWPVFVDRESGWVCLDGGGLSFLAVGVTSCIIIEIDQNEIPVRLWLKPKELPSL